MTGNAKTKQSPLRIVVVILAVIVVILFVSATLSISETARGTAPEYDARDYRYPAESGRYGMLYDTAIQDMGKHAAYSTDVGEYRALAFYYEQAVLEHAYRQAGEDAKADAFAERMKGYEEQLGSLSQKAADVRGAVAVEKADR